MAKQIEGTFGKAIGLDFRKGGTVRLALNRGEIIDLLTSSIKSKDKQINGALKVLNSKMFDDPLPIVFSSSIGNIGVEFKPIISNTIKKSR